MEEFSNQRVQSSGLTGNLQKNADQVSFGGLYSYYHYSTSARFPSLKSLIKVITNLEKPYSKDKRECRNYLFIFDFVK